MDDCTEDCVKHTTCRKESVDVDVDEALNGIANVAATANAIAALCVGHLRILVEGGFDVNLANSMTANLHGHLLGLHPVWHVEDEDVWPDDEDDE